MILLPLFLLGVTWGAQERGRGARVHELRGRLGVREERTESDLRTRLIWIYQGIVERYRTSPTLVDRLPILVSTVFPLYFRASRIPSGGWFNARNGQVDPDWGQSGNASWIWPLPPAGYHDRSEPFIGWLVREWTRKFEEFDPRYVNDASSLSADAVLEEWPGIVDWAAATRPNLSALTWDQAVDAAEAWHASFSTRFKALSDVHAGTVVAFWPDGGRVERLTTRTQLDDEGDFMHHCIGSYADQVRSGRTLAFSYRGPDGTPKCTWALQADGLELFDLEGPNNRNVQDKTAAARVVDWFTLMGLSLLGFESKLGDGAEALDIPVVPETFFPEHQQEKWAKQTDRPSAEVLQELLQAARPDLMRKSYKDGKPQEELLLVVQGRQIRSVCEEVASECGRLQELQERSTTLYHLESDTGARESFLELCEEEGVVPEEAAALFVSPTGEALATRWSDPRISAWVQASTQAPDRIIPRWTQGAGSYLSWVQVQQDLLEMGYEDDDIETIEEIRARYVDADYEDITSSIWSLAREACETLNTGLGGLWGMSEYESSYRPRMWEGHVVYGLYSTERQDEDAYVGVVMFSIGDYGEHPGWSADLERDSEEWHPQTAGEDDEDLVVVMWRANLIQTPLEWAKKAEARQKAVVASGVQFLDTPITLESDPNAFVSQAREASFLTTVRSRLR